ncbi:hypothetical protein ACTJKN_15675 [Pedobacter sp. 22163]|uniref:hypothetical protein n=1 Tax=Pedobacter sp. 22163 TaxID=3453883 RepID=UPI003F834CDA
MNQNLPVKYAKVVAVRFWKYIFNELRGLLLTVQPIIPLNETLAGVFLTVELQFLAKLFIALMVFGLNYKFQVILPVSNGAVY